jgi:hypothetical protein
MSVLTVSDRFGDIGRMLPALLVVGLVLVVGLRALRKGGGS